MLLPLFRDGFYYEIYNPFISVCYCSIYCLKEGLLLLLGVIIFPIPYVDAPFSIFKFKLFLFFELLEFWIIAVVFMFLLTLLF